MNIIRKLIEYSSKIVLVNAKFTLTFFEKLLFEVRSVLAPAQQVTGCERVSINTFLWKLENSVRFVKLENFGRSVKPKTFKLKNRLKNSESIFILKLQTNENQRKSDVSENSKAIYDFLQNEPYEGSIMLTKLDVRFVESTTGSNMLKDKCKRKDLRFICRSFILHLPLNKLFLAVLFIKRYTRFLSYYDHPKSRKYSAGGVSQTLDHCQVRLNQAISLKE